MSTTEDANNANASEQPQQAIEQENVSRENAESPNRNVVRVGEDAETVGCKRCHNAERDANTARAEADEERRRREFAEGHRWKAIIVALICTPIAIFSVLWAGSATISSGIAKTELAEYRRTVDERIAAGTAEMKAVLAAATERADERESEANRRVEAADRRVETADVAQNKALDDQRIAQEAHAKALDEQKAAISAANQVIEDRKAVENIAAAVERDKNTALEQEKIAREAEARVVAIKREADNTMTEARRMWDAAVKKEADADTKILVAIQEAKEQAARAEERADTAIKMERDRRMGIEAMLTAGTPLRFPLEDHERLSPEDFKRMRLWLDEHEQQWLEDGKRNEDAQKLRNEPSPPVARMPQEILREVVWRWTLEKELAIENKWEDFGERGVAVGEVTGRPRTGYRASLQGDPSNDPDVVLYNPAFAPPPSFAPLLGAFQNNRHLAPADMSNPMSPMEWTQSLAPTKQPREFLGNQEYSPWFWEDWWGFRAVADKEKNELGVLPGHTFSLPRDVIPPTTPPVKLDRRFMLSQTEVTQELWESVMGKEKNQSRFRDANRPVENVSWEDAQLFIAKLNEMREELGVPFGYEFTLPMEVEWELACRAAPTNAFWWKLDSQSMTPFYFGENLDSKQANIGNPRGGTNVVGKYPANAWGLHDMHGNVREWCLDALGYGPLSVQGRTSVSEGFYRSLRGGSWSLSSDVSRSAYRGSGNPERRHDDVGFRLALAATGT